MPGGAKLFRCLTMSMYRVGDKLHLVQTSWQAKYLLFFPLTITTFVSNMYFVLLGWHDVETFTSHFGLHKNWMFCSVNTLRTGDADLRFYITTVQDGWRKSAFLTRACFPCTVDLIMQYVEPVSEWSCWRMFIETWPHSELTFRHRASSI